MEPTSRLTAAIAQVIQAKLQSFDSNINRLSAASGIPYVTLHRKLGVTATTATKPFDTEQLVAIALALDTKASQIMEEAEAAA